MGWGIGLGAGADAAVSTYDKIQDDRRADESMQLKKNADTRAQAAENRVAADAAAESARLHALAGTADSGAPVVNPNNPAPDEGPVSVKSALPAASGLGGPKMVNDDGTPYTPPNDPKTGGAGAGPVGRPSPAPVEAAQSAGTEAVTQSTKAKSAIPTGGLGSDQLLAAFRKSPTPQGLADYQAAKTSEGQAALRNQQIRESEVRVRSAEHTLNQDDIKFSQDQSAKAAARATGLLDEYKLGDDVAATDPRVVDSTKRIMGALQETHSQMADGQNASYTIAPDGVHVTFKDAKSGKVISQQTLGTIGEVRGAVQQMGMATDPANYPKVIASNTATMLGNQIQKMAVGNGADAEGFKSSAVGGIKTITKAIQDPTGTPLLDPASRQKLEADAHMVAIMAPDQVEYDKKVPVLDENGAPKLDDHDRPVMQTIKGNRLLDAMEYNTPSKTTRVIDPKTNTMKTLSIDTAAKIAVDSYKDLLKSVPNHDPNLAMQEIRTDLLAQGFDQRTVDYYIPKIMTAGATAQAAGLKADVKPVAVKTNPAGSVMTSGPRGSAIPTTAGPSLLQRAGPTLDKMMTQGLRPQ